MTESWTFTREITNGDDTREVEVTVSIDPEMVANELWRKALRNKSKISACVNRTVVVAAKLTAITVTHDD